MRTTVLRTLAPRSFLFLAICAITTALLRGQESTAPTTPLNASKLIGEWQFNKELSTHAASSETASREGQRSGGNRGGGGFSGRGGFGGTYGGGGVGVGYNTGRSNEEQMAQMRALLKEVSETPDRVTLVATDTTVSFTDNQGIVRKYTLSGKKEKIDLGSVKIDATTKWTGQELTQELSAGQLKVTEHYTVNADGTRLTRTILIQGAALAGGNGGGGGGNAGTGGGNSNQRELTHVFDRVS